VIIRFSYPGNHSDDPFSFQSGWSDCIPRADEHIVISRHGEFRISLVRWLVRDTGSPEVIECRLERVE
jgi:hypothetical protein